MAGFEVTMYGRFCVTPEDYFALNNTLLIALVYVSVITLRSPFENFKRQRILSLGNHDPTTKNFLSAIEIFSSNVILFIWFAVSYVSVAIGGRSFPNYFYQVLPSPCLIGAHGLREITSTLKKQSAVARHTILALLTIGFLFTIVRFHGQTPALTTYLVQGTKSRALAEWSIDSENREYQLIAAAVRDLPDYDEEQDHLGGEVLRDRSPRTREVEGSKDYLFVWGARPDIYYWSGLLPASRYLNVQLLIGVPSDVHYKGNNYRSILDDSITIAARAELIQELERWRPKYIVDDLCMYNANLAITEYPELCTFIRGYKKLKTDKPFSIYIRRDMRRKRSPSKEQNHD